MLLPRIGGRTPVDALCCVRWVKKAWIAVALVAAWPAAVHAQTIDDGVMMSHRAFCTGFLYTHDRWDQYWEGTLKRVNGNIGAITTQSVTWAGVYGVTDRLNVIAMLPFVWTGASQGVLHGVRGLQDATVAAKYQLLDTELTTHGSLRTFVVASGSAPMSRYTPDYYPLSLGSASKRFSGRATVHFQAKWGWYVSGSAAYTWRDNVKLDRVAYFTNGQMYLSNEVAMPNVLDYTISVGYAGHGLQIPLSFTQQVTRGGGDIRRQDMPFVSNRMNLSQVGAVVLYALPKPRDLSVRVAATYVVDGRNVGQATSFTTGLLYTFHF
jgi:hypothetical protein